MCRGDDRDRSLLAGRPKRRRVTFEHRLEGLRVLPFRMLWRQRLDPVQRVGELHVDRLFDPQRAVVVERGDPLRWRNEVGRSFPGHVSDEGDDRLFRRAIVPRRQRIGLGDGNRDPGCKQGEGAKPGQANAHVCLPLRYPFSELAQAQRQKSSDPSLHR
jgi:hypothetical protein